MIEMYQIIILEVLQDCIEQKKTQGVNLYNNDAWGTISIEV